MTNAEPVTTIAPVRKTVTVPQSPADAFRLFTEHISEWWPLATHSVGGARAVSVHFGSAVGEQIVESIEGGDTATWGTVTVWEPPGRVVFTMHPGTPAEEATDVEVTFAPAAEGTLVTLTHRGWERRPDGAAWRESYETGWDPVLGNFVTRSQQPG